MYPGLGLPLRYYPQEHGNFYPMGAHEKCIGSCSQLLPVRELVMMDLMDKLTDKESWHQKVFNKEIVDKWRTEALALPDEVLWRQFVADDWDGSCPLEGIMTPEIFDYCIQELQNKARYFETSGIVPTLDATASVAKSDTLIEPGLHKSIRQAFNTLIKDQADSPDWHPGSNDMVQDLVHPSMYPLVYGESRVFEDELVGVTDAIDKWAGKGEKIGRPDVSNEFDRQLNGPWDRDYPFVPPSLWSETYQWLPSNVKFQDDGSVKFTSYINNLHPIKHSEIYTILETLVAKALPMWDQCLAPGLKSDSGSKRTSTRFSTTHDADDSNPDNWTPSEPSEIEINWDDMDSCYRPGPDEEVDEQLYEELQQEQWEELRKPKQRQPDPFEEIDYKPKQLQRLSKKFKESGLQIIVKMATIELTPSKPVFPAGSWHVEGQMNEKICATALFYVDEENIEPSSLSFRMATSSSTGEDDEFSVEQYKYHWLEQVYGTRVGMGNECVQIYGSVQTPQGRLLAFPNVFQHSVSSFGLKDPSKPGHRRFIALWLVDPHTRIISTANVPPQQQDWWNGFVLSQNPSNLPAELAQLLREKGSKPDDAELSHPPGKLPVELLGMVRSRFEAPVMSVEKAKEHREGLMKARTQFHKEAELHSGTYNFCEH